MNEYEVRDAIQKKFRGLYVGQFPIVMDNLKSSVPDQSPFWVRLNVLFSQVPGTSTLGNRDMISLRWIREGFLNIQVFTLRNKGTKRSDQRANEFLRVYYGIRLGDAWFYNGRVATVGVPNETDIYFQQNVILDFRFQETT